MKKISPRSYNGEVLSVIELILAAAAEIDWSTDSYFSSLLDNLRQKTEKMKLAINRNRSYSQLEVKDDARDGKIRQFHYLTVGYMNHPLPEVAEAAQTVFQVFDKYGLEIIEENYALESSSIGSLLRDLSEPNVLTAIAKLSGMDLSIAAIQTAEDDFHRSLLAYEAIKAQEGKYQNATELKREMVLLLNKQWIVYLQAMRVAAPDTYGAFADVVEQVIADNNEKIRKRKKTDTNPNPEQDPDEPQN